MCEKLKTFNEVKCVDDFNLGKLVLMRGDTPPDMRERCLQLCKTYLSDIWTQQTVDSIYFKRLTGGVTNQLYYCAIADLMATGAAPREVAIKYYNDDLDYDNNNKEGFKRLSDIITALLVSENKLGPKLYGVFAQGQILGFYKHRQFRADEHMDANLVTQVFKKLAQIHAMRPPIKIPTNDAILENYRNFCETGSEKYPINQYIEELNLQTFKTHDIVDEIRWLRQTIINAGCPIVYTHRDFRGSNILVTEPDDEVVICDFESSGYGYRGVDFGTIAVEWGRTLSEFGKSEKLIQKYPDDETLKTMIRVYTAESIRVLGDRFIGHENSVDHILREIKVFSLVAIMSNVMFSIKNDENIGLPVNKKVLMQYGENNYEGYWYLKNKFIRHHVFI